jgi:hypothetical protein
MREKTVNARKNCQRAKKLSMREKTVNAGAIRQRFVSILHPTIMLSGNIDHHEKILVEPIPRLPGPFHELFLVGLR